jgi:tRNA(Ile)-lysidine synthase
VMSHALPPVKLAAGGSVAVAVSGGRDSMALLHAVWQQAQRVGAEVWAFHVDHGLQAGSADWASWVEAQCRRWAEQTANDFSIQGSPGGAFRQARMKVARCRLESAPSAGESVEAWARTHRYAALRSLAQSHGVERVLLAHHLNDQAETFVLQAARGAGPAGLAGMPMCAQRDGISWERPWLQMPRSAIDRHVAAHAIPFLEDPSNAGQAFTRNRLRRQWPALEADLPGLAVGLARSARACASALEALDELAQLDLTDVLQPVEVGATSAEAPRDLGDAPTVTSSPNLSAGLNIKALRELSAARRANVLRHWWHRATGDRPRMVFVDRLSGLSARGVQNGATVPASKGAYALAHQGRWLARPNPPAACGIAPVSTEARVPVALRPGQAAALACWGGALLWTGASGSCPPALEGHLRPRQAGDRFSLGAQRPLRCLKKQYQAVGVPADDRGGPILTLPDGRVVWVHGLGWNAPVAAALGLTGQLAWVRAADPLTL